MQKWLLNNHFLKARFRILLKRQDTESHNLRYVIYACFLLYNICIDNNDVTEDAWHVINAENGEYDVLHEETNENVENIY